MSSWKILKLFVDQPDEFIHYVPPVVLPTTKSLVVGCPNVPTTIHSTVAVGEEF